MGWGGVGWGEEASRTSSALLALGWIGHFKLILILVENVANVASGYF